VRKAHLSVLLGLILVVKAGVLLGTDLLTSLRGRWLGSCTRT
jgi:hypothetical protein